MLNLRRFVFLAAVSSIFNCVSACRVTVPGTSPLFTQNFGTRTIAFKAREGAVNFEDSITAYCSNGEIAVTVLDYNDQFESYALTRSTNTVTLHCSNDEVMINTNSYSSLKISCTAEVQLKLYESNKVLPQCEGFNSYAIGFTHTHIGEVIKAGICYDLDALTLKFAMYVVPSKNPIIFEKERSSALPVSLDIALKTKAFSNYFDLVNENSLSGALANQFQVESLIQDEKLGTELRSFGSTLNTVWWRQLRVANWRHFLEALDQRTKSAKSSYLVSVGTYGNVTMPSVVNNCLSLKPELLTVQTRDTQVLVPAYVWAYVKSLAADDVEEFVVIAHNSPYAKEPDHRAFCAADICDNIEWLKQSKFGALRHLATLGYTFCCRPGEVAKVIDYFPLAPATLSKDTFAVATTSESDPDVTIADILWPNDYD